MDGLDVEAACAGQADLLQAERFRQLKRSDWPVRNALQPAYRFDKFRNSLGGPSGKLSDGLTK